MISENDIIASYIKTHYPDKLETLNFSLYKMAYIAGDAIRELAEAIRKCAVLDCDEGADDDT